MCAVRSKKPSLYNNTSSWRVYEAESHSQSSTTTRVCGAASGRRQPSRCYYYVR